MAKHHPTGPGVITIHPTPPRGGIRAVMSNYDIDVNTPKPEHIAFLNAQVVPIL